MLSNLSKVTQAVTRQNEDQSSGSSVSKALAVTSVPQGLSFGGRKDAVLRKDPSKLIRHLT